MIHTRYFQYVLCLTFEFKMCLFTKYFISLYYFLNCDLHVDVGEFYIMLKEVLISDIIKFSFFSNYRSMRQNLIAMLADLFNMLEVHPVKSVKYPGAGKYPARPYCML